MALSETGEFLSGRDVAVQMYDYIQGVALYLLQDEDLAQEATQEFWIKAGSTEHVRHAKAWIWMTMRFVVRTLWRDIARRDKIDKAHIESATELTTSPHVGLEEYWDGVAAYNRLSIRNQEVIYLYYATDLTYEQIGCILNTTRLAIGQQLRRARVKFKEELGYDD